MAVPVMQWPLAGVPGRADGVSSPRIRRRTAPPHSPGQSDGFCSPCTSPRATMPAVGSNAFVFQGMSPATSPVNSPRGHRLQGSSSFSFGGRSSSFGSFSAPADAQPPPQVLGTTGPSFQLQFKPEEVAIPRSPRVASPRSGSPVGGYSPGRNGNALAKDPEDMRARAAARLQALRAERSPSPPREFTREGSMDTGDGGVGPTTLGAGRLSPKPPGLNGWGPAVWNPDQLLAQPVQIVDLGERPRSSAGNAFTFDVVPSTSHAASGRAFSPAGRAGGYGMPSANGYRVPVAAPPTQIPRSPSAAPRGFEEGPSPRPAKPQPRPGPGGLLIVCYMEGEKPMNDLPRLEGGSGMHVIVAAVAPDSKAARAGVKPGFALATVNGRSEFMKLPGWQVRMLLEAPITIGFDPSPGTRSAPVQELRLAPSAKTNPTLGIPTNKTPWSKSRNGEAAGEAQWVVAEEVVFKPTDDYLANERAGYCFTPDQNAFADMVTVAGPLLSGASERLRALSPGRTCSPQRQNSGAAPQFSEVAVRGPSETSRYRNDRSPLRWLAPVLHQFMDTVCADGSDDTPDGDTADNARETPMTGGVHIGKGFAPVASPRGVHSGLTSPRAPRRPN